MRCATLWTLRLSDNRRLRLNWHPTTPSLSVELWCPGTLRDRHGFICAAYVLFRDRDLAQVVRAVAKLR